MIYLRIFGKLLISVGVGVLLFVAWTLWGTGIYTAQQQQNLADEFEALPPIEAEKEKGGYSSPPAGFNPGPGTPVFRIRIPAIQLTKVVVEGVGTDELRLGPGHYPGCRPGFSPPLCTPFREIYPGEKGRVVVSGHRTTYGQPFWDLHKLGRGDEIQVETKWGDFTYEVTHSEIVPPNSTDIVVDRERAEIVLTTCNPRFSAAERLIVFASMVTT